MIYVKNCSLGRDDLKKREQEAVEFFQEQETDDNWNSRASDSDESEEEQENKDMDEPKNEDEKPEELPNEVQSNECEDLQKNLDASTAKETEELEKSKEIVINETSDKGIENESRDQNNAIEATDMIELHTIQTELDDELDAMPTNTNKIKIPFPTDFVPKLKGEKGFVIDLETNDVKPIPKTGVDELFERFMGNAVVKPQKVETQDIRFDSLTIVKSKLDLIKKYFYSFQYIPNGYWVN